MATPLHPVRKLPAAVAWLLAALCFSAALLPVPVRAADPGPSPNPDALLQKALIAEESRRDLESAIATYEQVVRAVDDQRRLAATAVYRLGECYRKSGRTNDAVAQYQRLLRDFSGEETLARLSRQNLTALGAAIPPPPSATGMPAALATAPAVTAAGTGPKAATAAGRAQQVALLEEEIGLLDRQLAATRLRFQSGAIDQNAVWALERELLQLRRQLVALREPPARVDLLDVNLDPPANPELEALVARLAEFEQRSPRERGALAAFQEVFPDPELRDTEKKLKEAESRLSSLQSNNSNDENASEISSAESEVSRLKSRLQTRWNAVLAEQRIRAQSLGASASPASTTGGSDANSANVSAVDTAEIARLRALIQQSPDLLDSPTGDPSMAPLHRAAAAGQLAVVRFLLEQKADVNNPRSPQNWTPLHHAASKGHKAVVELLLARGADPNAAARDGITPLHLAVSREYREVVRVLLAGGAKIDVHGGSYGSYRMVGRNGGWTQEKDSRWTPLHVAAEQGLTNILALLLASGADLQSTTAFGLSPLHVAIEARRLPVVAQLLDAKADPNRTDESGRTPLHVALGAAPSGTRYPGPGGSETYPSPEIARTLLDHGADPKLPTSAGMTPLLLVLQRPQNYASSADFLTDTNLVAALLDAGADPNQGTPNGTQYPLTDAISNNDLDTVRLLLEHKANPNVAVGENAETPLHRAVARRNRAMIELLLARGADRTLRLRTGQTAEDLVNPRPAGAGQGTVSTIEFPTVPGAVPAGVPMPLSTPGQPVRFPSRLPGAMRGATPNSPATDVEIADLFRARTNDTNAAAPSAAPAPR